ncbi:MAG: LytR C-terminal domain-containing protein [Candidatus Levybacteria bacterium]|nr:LytR C-terminal domain-containing protein [Candidatus Levybacteria bacterium]
MEEASFQTPPPSDNFYTPSAPPAKSRNFGRLIVVVLILGILIFGAYRLIGSRKTANIPAVVPTPTEFQFPTDTPTPQVSITPGVTTAPSVNPIDSSTGLDRSTLTVEVQNGSGVVGAASKASDALKSFGYHITAMGNADNFNYENATVQVKSSKSKYLPLLKKDLGFSYTVASASSDLSDSSSADALVIIGK